MTWLTSHLRTKIAAGVLAVIPILLLVYTFRWIEANTSHLATELLGFNFPGMGILLTVLVIYLLGVLVTSLLGRVVLKVIDLIYNYIPGFNYLYEAWKETAVSPGGPVSGFQRVVLVPDLDGKTAQFGFAVGESPSGEAPTLRVFLPNLPNLLSGRLVSVPRESCLPLKLSVGAAVKLLLSARSLLSKELPDQSGPVHPEERQTELKT
jgi:uncharacterized membrane protein